MKKAFFLYTSLCWLVDLSVKVWRKATERKVNNFNKKQFVVVSVVDFVDSVISDDDDDDGCRKKTTLAV